MNVGLAVKPFRDARNAYSQERCGICLDDFTTASRVAELACGHLFHAECIERMNECGFCRAPIQAKVSKGETASRICQVAFSTLLIGLISFSLALKVYMYSDILLPPYFPISS